MGISMGDGRYFEHEYQAVADNHEQTTQQATDRWNKLTGFTQFDILNSIDPEYKEANKQWADLSPVAKLALMRLHANS